MHQGNKTTSFDLSSVSNCYLKIFKTIILNRAEHNIPNYVDLELTNWTSTCRTNWYVIYWNILIEPEWKKSYYCLRKFTDIICSTKGTWSCGRSSSYIWPSCLSIGAHQIAVVAALAACGSAVFSSGSILPPIFRLIWCAPLNCPLIAIIYLRCFRTEFWGKLNGLYKWQNTMLYILLEKHEQQIVNVWVTDTIYCVLSVTKYHVWTLQDPIYNI